MTILPTIVLVPGACHGPEVYGSVISILETSGYKCVAIPMPGAGKIPAVDSLDEDIQAVRSVVMKELDAGLDVVINSPSWAAIPVTSALDGLSRAEREKDGKKGAVVKLVFISSFVLPENMSLLDAIGGAIPRFWQIREDGFVVLDDRMTRFYHDLEPKEQQYWCSRLRPQSLKTWTAKTKSAAWKKISSVYLVCEDDRLISVQSQEAIIAAMKEAGANVETERIFTGHSAILVNPTFVAGLIRKAAGGEGPANL